MIPRIIHQVWVGPPMPADLADYCAGWRSLHAGPAWEYRLWQDEDLETFRLRNRALYDRAAEIAPGHEGAFKADIARYEILLRHGGIYLDCDIEACKPLDPLIAAGFEAFATWERPGRWISNAVMGAEPGTPLMEMLVAELAGHVEQQLAEARDRDRTYGPNILTGPQYLTGQYHHRPQSLTILPKGWFHPYLYSELDRGREAFPGAYGVHHWHSRRTERATPR